MLYNVSIQCSNKFAKPCAPCYEFRTAAARKTIPPANCFRSFAANSFAIAWSKSNASLNGIAERAFGSKEQNCNQTINWFRLLSAALDSNNSRLFHKLVRLSELSLTRRLNDLRPEFAKSKILNRNVNNWWIVCFISCVSCIHWNLINLIVLPARVVLFVWILNFQIENFNRKSTGSTRKLAIFSVFKLTPGATPKCPLKAIHTISSEHQNLRSSSTLSVSLCFGTLSNQLWGPI